MSSKKTPAKLLAAALTAFVNACGKRPLYDLHVRDADDESDEKKVARRAHEQGRNLVVDRLQDFIREVINEVLDERLAAIQKSVDDRLAAISNDRFGGQP